MGCMTMSTAQQVLRDHTAFLVTWLSHQLRLGEDRKPCLELNDQVTPKFNRELLISESHCNTIRSQGRHLENIGGFFFFKASTYLVFSNFVKLSVFLPPFLLNGSLIFTQDQEIEEILKKISKPVCFSELHTVSCKTLVNARSNSILKVLSRVINSLWGSHCPCPFRVFLCVGIVSLIETKLS